MKVYFTIFIIFYKNNSKEIRQAVLEQLEILSGTVNVFHEYKQCKTTRDKPTADHVVEANHSTVTHLALVRAT